MSVTVWCWAWIHRHTLPWLKSLSLKLDLGENWVAFLSSFCSNSSYSSSSSSQIHSYCSSELREEDRPLDHPHQHVGVAGQLPPHHSCHDIRQGGSQAAPGGVHNGPGRAGGHVLVHALPVYPRLHHPSLYHQHLLLANPLSRFPVHPASQAKAVCVGETSH